MFQRLLFIILAAALLLGVLLYSQLRSQPVTVSGTIEADEIRIGSLVGGRVERVLVIEGQSVQAGEPLVELAPFDLRQRRAEAAATLEAARAEEQKLTAGFRAEEVAQAQAMRDQFAARLELLEAGPRSQEIVAADARLAAAGAELKLAMDTLQRTQLLFQQNASTQERLDQATEQQRAAEAMQTVRQQELALLQEGTRREEIAEARAMLAEAEATLALRTAGYRQEEIEQARATAAAAQASLDVIEKQIEELTIRAPVDSYVEALDLQPGDLVSPRAPVLSLMDRKELWLRTFVPLNRQDVQLEQEFQIAIDSYPDRTFPARVTFISRDPEFTPSNSQTPEDRQKQVFRVKISFTGDTTDLRPGMTGEVILGRE